LIGFVVGCIPSEADGTMVPDESGTKRPPLTAHSRRRRLRPGDPEYPEIHEYNHTR
jgi:hypothetical protein